MPRFQFSTPVTLDGLLKEHGLRTLFDPARAKLPGITGDEAAVGVALRRGGVRERRRGGHAGLGTDRRAAPRRGHCAIHVARHRPAVHGGGRGSGQRRAPPLRPCGRARPPESPSGGAEAGGREQPGRRVCRVGGIDQPDGGRRAVGTVGVRRGQLDAVAGLDGGAVLELGPQRRPQVRPRRPARPRPPTRWPRCSRGRADRSRWPAAATADGRRRRATSEGCCRRAETWRPWAASS